MSDTTKRVNERRTAQWHGHRLAAMALRVVVLLCPVAVAAFVGLIVSRSIPGDSPRAYVIRVVLAAVASVLAFLVVERLGRRVLPLAVLLRLNLVFPDRAPSRFSVALRSGSVRKLQRWAREAHESDDGVLADRAALAEKVVTLAAALNSHDRRTRGHCERTRALADLIIEEMRLSPTEANEVRWGAFLHDIGKLAVPVEILNKPGKPTASEWEVLKRHPEAGARLVEPLRSFLHSGVDAVADHHENYDGSGYPAGRSGEHLALAARIVTVADSFEVMTAVRAYKRPMTAQAARAELARRSGTQFDPQVVRAFLNVSLGRLHWAVGFAAWIAELPFLTILPRLAAQVSATAGGGGGGISAAALPSIAAASLGTIAAISHAESPATHPPVAAARASAPSSAQPSAIGAGSSPASGEAPTSTGAAAPPTVPSLTSTLSQALGATKFDAVGGALADGAAAANSAGATIGSVGNTVSHEGASGTLGASVNAIGNAIGKTANAVSSPAGGTVDGTVDDTVADVLGGVSAISDAPVEAKGSTPPPIL
jgi:hypothetical protein